ncbi:MAG: SAM-dependent chlorinase/fluorinase [Nitrospira sp.]|nr:SAM-dependent chlorinase/fluorinase [Nitrospira sp.]
MSHPLGLITLLTDFGSTDWFVASMKGVILSINPQATIIDLTHEVPPHAVEHAAYLLRSCYRSFPPGTVHVAVVDPGVGSERRPLIAKSARYFFLAPDNGLLSHVAEDEQDIEVREIENKQYRLEPIGRTFDGRDLFAPAAAWLTKHESFASFGRLLQSYRKFHAHSPRWERAGEQAALVGEVVHIDRFGNLITNLATDHVKQWQAVAKRPNPTIRLLGHVIEGLVGSYSEGDSQTPHALINSGGHVEIFLKESSASLRLSILRGEPVRLS